MTQEPNQSDPEVDQTEGFNDEIYDEDEMWICDCGHENARTERCEKCGRELSELYEEFQ